MAGWTESMSLQIFYPYPRDKSFSNYHMNLCQRMLFNGMGDPMWNCSYIREGLTGWKKYKPLWDRLNLVVACVAEVNDSPKGQQQDKNKPVSTLDEDEEDVEASKLYPYAQVYTNLKRRTI